MRAGRWGQIRRSTKHSGTYVLDLRQNKREAFFVWRGPWRRTVLCSHQRAGHQMYNMAIWAVECSRRPRRRPRLIVDVAVGAMAQGKAGEIAQACVRQ